MVCRMDGHQGTSGRSVQDRRRQRVESTERSPAGLYRLTQVLTGSDCPRSESSSAHRRPLPMGEGRGEGPKAERSNGPYGLPPPSGCAWVGVWAGWRLHRRMQLLRDLTGRGCLNEAPKARSEFCGPARTFPDTGCPVAIAKGSQPAGRTSFAFFSCASKKRGSPAGASPGLPTPTQRNPDQARNIKNHSCPRPTDKR